MLIAVDHGNFACKSMTKDSFISGLTEHSIQPPLASDVIEYEDRFWTLSSNRIAFMLDKTKDIRFFVLTLFAIARELKSHEEQQGCVEIDLAAGLPPEHYSALKDKFTKYLLRDTVTFRYNGNAMKIKIRRVFVYPQAYAAVVPQSRLLINTPRMFVIDIGGFTTDVIQIIKESAKRYADRILDQLRELQVDLRSNPVIFVGGGSLLFKLYLENSPMVAKVSFVTDRRLTR